MTHDIGSVALDEHDVEAFPWLIAGLKHSERCETTWSRRSAASCWAPSTDPVRPCVNGPPAGTCLGGSLRRGTEVSREEDEGAADAGAGGDNQDTGYASPISMAMNPSSIGLSFTVGPEVQQLSVTAEWGSYGEDKIEVERRDGRTGQATVWVREHHSETVDMAVSGLGEHDIGDGARIQWLSRMLPDGRRRAVSVFLVNRVRSRNPGRPDDSEWLFQPMLSICHPDGAAVFEPRSLDDVVDFETLDADRRADELLFRDRPEYAVGHGCSADWDAEGGLGATEVTTVILPVHELPRTRTDPRGGQDLNLDMRLLGGSGPDGVPGDQLREMLLPLADAYEGWIEGLADRAAGLGGDLRAQADVHFDACREVHERIIEGIELLGRSDDAAELARRAFCFANRAMALQRERSKVALSRRRGEEPSGSTGADAATWRPFQLAFVLINLSSLVDRTHQHRRTCDLLWFPTGGGKTEAYLGLTAFVLAHRRLRPAAAGHRVAGGVSVLMRYTLRLLTLQQFQRATALVCACEYLRVKEGQWGDERFSIGLWVGLSATPNRYSDPDGLLWGRGQGGPGEVAPGAAAQGGNPGPVAQLPVVRGVAGP